MLRFEILEIEKCNIELLEQLYNIYNIYSEDRSKNNYLNEIVIEKFYTNIIIIYDNKNIVGYTLVRLENKDDIMVIIVGDSVLIDKYVGNSIISYSFFNFVKQIYNKNKKIYGFWLCNTIYTYLFGKHFKKYYPNINCKHIPNEYKNIYIECLKLFTDNIYNNEKELKLVIEYEKNFGKVREKYAKIRNNFKMNEHIELFLDLNKNYLNGDCLCLLCEITLEDIENILNKYEKKKNRLGMIISHFISIFT